MWILSFLVATVVLARRARRLCHFYVVVLSANFALAASHHEGGLRFLLIKVHREAVLEVLGLEETLGLAEHVMQILPTYLPL